MRIETSRSKMVVGALIGLGLAGGIYAAAAGAASTIAGSFVTAETVSHRRNVDFSVSSDLATAQYARARVLCDTVAAKATRKVCHAEAKLKNTGEL